MPTVVASGAGRFSGLRSAFSGAVLKMAVMGLVAASVAPVSASAKAPTGKPASQLLGKVYEGTLSSRIIPPKGSGQRPMSHHGRATAVLEATGKGAARFILNGTLQKDGDASFFAPGQFSGADWGGRSQSFQLAIHADGMVKGSGTFEGQPMTFDGNFTGNDLRLVVEITVPRQTPGGFPPGTRFQFLYQLRHFPPSVARSGGATGKGGCKEVVYRLKLTPNLFGSGLSSVRVPECRR